MTSPSVPVLQRIISNVEKQPSGCWCWTRAHDVAGYGKIRIKGRLQTVHRVVYELLRDEIPDGLVIDHLCGNPACCNPAHLEAVTQQENVRRGKHGSKTHCPKGHPYAGDNLFVTKSGRRTCKACRKRWQRPYVPVPPKTHCKHGHPFDRDNTLWTNGRRSCRACARANALAAAARRARTMRAIKKLMQGSVAA